MSLTDLSSAPTYRSTRGRVPIFRPLLAGQEFQISVNEASLVLGEHVHDMATLSCTSADLTTTEGLIDKPISFFYGQAPRTELFNGYIVNVGESKAGQGNLTFTLNVLGPTKTMQTNRPRFWRNKTIPSAVESLAYTGGLGFTSHPHTHVWSALAQTSETDWQQAVTLTKRIGWSLFNRYGVVLCYDPNVLMRETGAYTTLRSMAEGANTDGSTERRLIEFNPQERADVTQTLGGQVAYFTENGTVQVSKQAGKFKRYQFNTAWPVRNADEATLYVNAGASRIEEWTQRAEARIAGDADIYPGMCVDVVTTNRARVRQQFDGRWLVRGVAHKMDQQQFQTQLALARPASDTPITQAAYLPFWDLLGKARPNLMLREDQWTSSWTDPRIATVFS